MADALLAREVLDAEQVKRIAAGSRWTKLSQLPPVWGLLRADEDESRPRQKERTPIVPSINKPLPQE